jgi:hypothetical protein
VAKLFGQEVDEFQEVDLVEALAFILYMVEDDGDLYPLVEKLCEEHSAIVEKLHFYISSYNIDKNITQSKGEHHAH